MQHEMHLNELPFVQFRDGIRSIEARLNDDKRRRLKIGDIIKFINTSNNSEVIETEIVDLYTAPDFDQLFDLFRPQEFGGASKEELLNSIYKYYSKEDEQRYGVLGIKIKLI